jgi:hypothetical protein
MTLTPEQQRTAEAEERARGRAILSHRRAQPGCDLFEFAKRLAFDTTVSGRMPDFDSLPMPTVEPQAPIAAGLAMNTRPEKTRRRNCCAAVSARSPSTLLCRRLWMRRLNGNMHSAKRRQGL